MALTAAARRRRRPLSQLGQLGQLGSLGRPLRALSAQAAQTAQAAVPVAAEAAGKQTEATRHLIASWLSHPQPIHPQPIRPQPIRPGQEAGGGLAVPHAEAATVVDAARELAGAASPSAQQPVPPAGLLRLAEVMVVAEHPSASGWTAAERRLAASWIAVLLDRQGEDGVQRLVRALCAVPAPARPSSPVRLSSVAPESGPARG